MGTLLTLGCTLPYTSLIGYLIVGMARLRPQKQSVLLPSTSIIVPLRNEENNVDQMIHGLLHQDYKGTFEIICIEDRSTDSTWEKLVHASKQDSRIHLVRILPSEGSVVSPKKRALDRGIASANGEVILTTDADCLPPPNWLSSMLACMDDKVGVVQGPKHIISSKRPIHRYQALEVFGLVCVEAATFAWGKPLLASAPSLAYRKKLFLDVQGFDGLMDLVSGDDDMLVHKMIADGHTEVRYNVNPLASVGTHPVDTWKELLVQRSRWSSNGTKYPSLPYVFLLIAIYTYYCMFVVLPILALFGLVSWWLVLVHFTWKSLLDFSLLNLGAKKLGFKGLGDTLFAQLVHIPVVVLAVPLGILGFYGWKR